MFRFQRKLKKSEDTNISAEEEKVIVEAKGEQISGKRRR